MSPDTYQRARAFVYANARLLEQRLFAALFEGGSPGGVVDALRGYQNDDGGFGHGLEPDKRCPASLPGDVELALEMLVAAGAREERMVQRACGFLSGMADADGAVALATPVIEGYPRAEHWTEWTYVPGVFPTAGLAGLLHALDVAHPWLEQATGYCWSTLAAGLPDDAHALREVLVFCAHVGDRDRAADLARRAVGHLEHASWYLRDPDDPSYGVTPLHLVPAPDGPWRGLFDDALVEGHLARLARDQQDDGGWPITWEPPSPAAVFEWRGIETVRALRVLAAYGRLPDAPR